MNPARLNDEARTRHLSQMGSLFQASFGPEILRGEWPETRGAEPLDVRRLATQRHQKIGHILRQGRGKAQLFTRHRMHKPQSRRMQRLPGKVQRRRLPHIAHRLGVELPPPTINRIANQRMSHMGHMHTDLMGASGLEPALGQRRHRRLAQRLHDPRPRHRVAPAVKAHRLPLPIGLVAPQMGLDLQDIPRLETRPLNAMQARVVLILHAVTDRQIMPLDRVFLELRRKPMMRPIALGGHQEPARLLVDPVHDPRTLLAPHARQALAAMVDQCIHERPPRRSGRGMDNHARRFIDNDQIVILIKHLERDLFRADMALVRLLDADLDLVALTGAKPRVGDRRTIDRNRPPLDQLAKPRPRQRRLVWHIARKRLIKAGRRILFDPKRDNGHGHMDTSSDNGSLPPQLIFLKRLVTALGVVMIGGFLVLIAALVIRLNADPLPLPDRITLPEGVTATAFTQGTDWFAVVTSDNRILIYDRTTSALRQEVTVD